MPSRGSVHSDFSFIFEVRSAAFSPCVFQYHYPEIVAESESKQLDSVIIAHQLQNARDITKAVRSQFGKQSAIDRSTQVESDRDVELDVQVHVEHSVTVDYPSQEYEIDSYRKPSYVVWNPHK